MTSKLFSNQLLIGFIFSSLASVAIASESSPRRISGQIIDLGKVHSIYMVPGMATMIEVPSAVTGIRLGNPDAVQYFRPDKPENEVTLVLKDAHAKPTNLIIRSGKRKFVFDVIPNQQVHQDTIEVVGAYGGAQLNDVGAVLLDSSGSTTEHPQERKQ